MIEISYLQFCRGLLSLSLPLSFHLRRSPSAPHSAVAAPTHTRAHAHLQTTETHWRAHLPLPAVSLFSANVAKCLHFCITATIKPASLLVLLLSSRTPLPLALHHFLSSTLSPPHPSHFVLYPSLFRSETGLRVGIEKKNFLKFSLSSGAHPWFPPSYSLPSLFFIPLISCPSLFLSLLHPLQPPPLLLFHPSILHASPPPSSSPPLCSLSVLYVFLS